MSWMVIAAGCVDLSWISRFPMSELKSVSLGGLVSMFHSITLCTDTSMLTVYVIVRPLSTVGYTSVAASVIHSRQWSN